MPYASTGRCVADAFGLLAGDLDSLVVYVGRGDGNFGSFGTGLRRRELAFTNWRLPDQELPSSSARRRPEELPGATGH